MEVIDKQHPSSNIMDSKVKDVLGGFEASSTNAKSLEEKVASLESKVHLSENQIRELANNIRVQEYAIDDLKTETMTIMEQIRNLEYELQAQSDSKESLLLDLRDVENKLVESKEHNFQSKNEYILSMINIEVEYMRERECLVKELVTTS
jgi:chromosome segregation ATPase